MPIAVCIDIAKKVHWIAAMSETGKTVLDRRLACLHDRSAGIVPSRAQPRVTP